MNPPIHMQLVKWTVPVVAFVIAVFWYRRRRIDGSELERNDPGGDAAFSPEDDTAPSEETEISSLRKSDLQEEASRSSSSCNCTVEEADAEDEEARAAAAAEGEEEAEEEAEVQEPATRVSTRTSEMEMTEINSRFLLGFDEMMNEHCCTDAGFDGCFSGSLCETPSNNPVEYMTNVFHENGSEQQIVYYETQPSQQQYIVDEYNCGGDEQQAMEHVEDTVAGHRHVYERDSANHSPVSEGTVTPDETQSEGSMDSGKGGSINENRKNNTVSTTYDFSIPQHLVGRLIGRHGSFLHSIRTKTNVAIYVHDHPYDGDHKICSMQGNTDEIDVALKMVRQKFPEKKFPEVTLAEVLPISETITDIVPYVPSWITLSLIDGVNNDVSVSHIVKPNWLFVNLPTHPTYLSLRNLESEMLPYYNSMEPPSQSDVVKKDDCVAVLWNERWVRACVQKTDSTGGYHVIRLVDYGGYWIYKSHHVRLLNSSHMILPFQAIEIFIANIQPKNGIWLQSAYDLVSHICKSGIGKAHVEGYIENNVYTNIYFTYNNYGVFSLADELIAKGYAEPIAWEQMQSEKFEAVLPPREL